MNLRLWLSVSICKIQFSAFTILIFSSFDSFPDRRQVVYTVETLELQKFSRNS